MVVWEPTAGPPNRAIPYRDAVYWLQPLDAGFGGEEERILSNVFRGGGLCLFPGGQGARRESSEMNLRKFSHHSARGPRCQACAGRARGFQT